MTSLNYQQNNSKQLGPFEYMMKYLREYPPNKSAKWNEERYVSSKTNDSETKSEQKYIWAITPESKVGQFKCSDCNADFNSQNELDIHKKSKAHAFNNYKLMSG